jgi:hypothetical protein
MAWRSRAAGVITIEIDATSAHAEMLPVPRVAVIVGPRVRRMVGFHTEAEIEAFVHPAPR